MDAQREAVWRQTGDVLQVLPLDLSNADAEYRDAVLPQMLSRHFDIIIGGPISDDQGDLGHLLLSAAPSFFREVIRLEKFEGLSRKGFSVSPGNVAHCIQHGLFVCVILQEELLVRHIAVLRQAELNLVEADFEALDDAADEITDFLKVIKADACGAVDEEDDVGPEFVTFWTGET